MTVNGSEIIIFDDFEIEFGEALVFTTNRLERRRRHAKREFDKASKEARLVIKNVSFCDIPAKCCLEYDLKDKLKAVVFKIAVEDYIKENGSENDNAASEKLLAYLIEGAAKIFSVTHEVYKTSISLSGTSPQKAIVRIFPS